MPDEWVTALDQLEVYGPSRLLETTINTVQSCLGSSYIPFLFYLQSPMVCQRALLALAPSVNAR